MARADDQNAQTGKTQQLLLAAALQEFSEHGFVGTDTNKIARRAGFAPQTFYRWFKDKVTIFLAVYRTWEDDEARMMAELARARAPASDVIDALIEHHKNHRLFRRSLRQLSLEDETVRRARAESRQRQLERIGGRGAAPDDLERLSVILLEIERLCDAIAEEEFADMGFGITFARAELERLMKNLEQKS